MLEGSIVALATPFRNGAVDLRKLEALTHWHIEKGTHGIVPLGTTGEAPAIALDERVKIIRTVVKAARGRVPVVPGTGTNDTRHTIELTKMARELGADAALVVTPYYNKPPQEGLYLHFEAVAKAGDLPIVLYNVPGRTAVNLLPETVARLAKIRTVTALKDASGNLEQVSQTRALCGITILSGEDALTYPILALGGRGVISVAANVIPSEMAALCTAANGGDHTRARRLHERYLPLFKGLFLETSPIPVKAAMEMMGLCRAETRLPLCPISDAAGEKLRGILRSYDLLKKSR